MASPHRLPVAVEHRPPDVANARLLEADGSTHDERARAGPCQGDRRVGGGRLGRGGAALDDLLLRWPADLLALLVGHQLDFFLGDAANLRDRPGRTLPALDPSIPTRRSCAACRPSASRSRATTARPRRRAGRPRRRTPTTSGRVHAVVHTYEMQGRVDEGIGFLVGPRRRLGRRQPVHACTTGGTSRSTCSRPATRAGRSPSTTPRSTTPSRPACRSRCSTPARCCGGCCSTAHDTGDRFGALADAWATRDRRRRRGTRSTTCTRSWRSSAPGGSRRPSDRIERLAGWRPRDGAGHERPR